jgi:hypothetical protein
VARRPGLVFPAEHAYSVSLNVPATSTYSNLKPQLRSDHCSFLCLTSSGPGYHDLKMATQGNFHPNTPFSHRYLTLSSEVWGSRHIQRSSSLPRNGDFEETVGD